MPNKSTKKTADPKRKRSSVKDLPPRPQRGDTVKGGRSRPNRPICGPSI